MNIFINIYRNWTVYEWRLILGSTLLIFLLNNIATYILTKKWKLNISLSLTYIGSALIYTLVILLMQFFPIPLSHMSLIPVLVIALMVSLNWITFISYYHKHKDRKGFSLIELIDEHQSDTIRNIVFLTIAILSVSIFLRGELLLLFINIYITSSLSMYLGTILTRKFIND